ncbi:hypothetical protein [Kitasatospora terrestris]|uniref:Lipoprotein n=1 Tax=Kitasatospora terrestris TaxID=258051 RepID=A0ABP9DNF7_9ACTN
MSESARTVERSADLPADPPAPRTAARPRRRRPTGNGRRLRLAAAVLAAAVAVVGVCSLEPVRTVLEQSFTKQQTPFAELYFTASPTFEGATVVVPLALNDHGTGAKSYEVKVTLESADGKAVATTSVPLVPHEGAPVPIVVRLDAKGEVSVVRVSLPGHPQKLHYRFGSAQIKGKP